MLKREEILFTTDASGVAASYGAARIAKLYCWLYKPGTTDTGATVTLTSEGDASKPLDTKATAGTSNTWHYPRDLVNAVADDALLTGTAGGDRALPIMDGRTKVAIAAGGNTKSGSVIIYYEE